MVPLNDLVATVALEFCFGLGHEWIHFEYASDARVGRVHGKRGEVCGLATVVLNCLFGLIIRVARLG